MSMLQYQTWWELWVGQFRVPFPKQSGHIKFVLYYNYWLCSHLIQPLSFIQIIICGKQHLVRGCNYLVLSGGVESGSPKQFLMLCSPSPRKFLTNQDNHDILSQWDFLALKWHKKSNKRWNCGRKMIFLFSLQFKMFLLSYLIFFDFAWYWTSISKCLWWCSTS